MYFNIHLILSIKRLQASHVPVVILKYLAHLTEKESEESEDDKVSATGKVRQFIHLKSGRDRKEDQLHTNGHDRADGEVILV